MNRDKIAQARKEAIEFILCADIVLALMEIGIVPSAITKPLGDQGLKLRLALTEMRKGK